MIQALTEVRYGQHKLTTYSSRINILQVHRDTVTQYARWGVMEEDTQEQSLGSKPIYTQVSELCYTLHVSTSMNIRTMLITKVYMQ